MSSLRDALVAHSCGSCWAGRTQACLIDLGMS